MRLSVRAKLMGVSGLLLAFTAGIGLLAIFNLGGVNTVAHSMYVDRTLPIGQLGLIQQALIDEQRINLRGILDAGKADVFAGLDKEVADDEKLIAEQLTAYKGASHLDSEKAALSSFETAYAQYQKLRDATRDLARTGDKEKAVPANLEALTAFKAAKSAAAELIKVNTEEAKRLSDQVNSTFESSRLIVIIALLGAVLAGLLISFWISGAIASGVRSVQNVLRSIADSDAAALEGALGALAANDLTVRVTSATTAIEKYGTDEIGQTAAVANTLLARIQATVDSYETARAGLSIVVSDVKDASDAVAQTSGQLNQAANQTGAATSQVAQTIQQVAAGAADQARAASETSGAVGGLAGVIEQVGASAAFVAGKVEAAATTIEQLTGAINQAAVASGEVGTVSEDAASAASNGATAVKETVAGMARIKKAVDDSSVKVTELGAKGEQIGAIVETIDDIAEQTNLLALNAAIEAARAGEQGKGFAVVADEVRKLAERSGRATKEIAALIAEVQAGTSEAVKAMTVGAAEVETGTELAARSGAALTQIADAVTATRAAVGRITAAVEAMGQASSLVVRSMDEIAGIAEANRSAATEMTANASAASRSVESIAAVSEENSAATQEVSAATGEMSAQVEETVASAQALAEMARRLDALVTKFHLDGDPADQTAVLAPPVHTGRPKAA